MFLFAFRNMNTFKVLTDSDQDDYELLRRTPRRVRFGGEIVKMRTPDSDSNHPSDDNDTSIVITPGDQTESLIEIRYVENGTRITNRRSRSLIPVRKNQTQSAPNSPRKDPKINRAKSKSSPNLTRQNNLSKIPRMFEHRKEIYTQRSIHIKINETNRNIKKIEKPKIYSNTIQKSSQPKQEIPPPLIHVKLPEIELKKTNELFRKQDLTSKVEQPPALKNTLELTQGETLLTSPTPRPRRNSREGGFSPICVHNEIEVLHNLTRSPERTAKSITTKKEKEENQEKTDKNKLKWTTNDLQNIRENAEERHLTTADNILYNTVNKEEKRNIRTADQIKKNFSQIPSIFNGGINFNTRPKHDNENNAGNEYVSFQVYPNESNGFSDSPIPNNGSGECLTCSSSGSDTVACEKVEGQFGSLDREIIEDLLCKVRYYLN